MYYKFYRRRTQIYILVAIVLVIIFYFSQSGGSSSSSDANQNDEILVGDMKIKGRNGAKQRINMQNYQPPPLCGDCPGENGKAVYLTVCSL